VILILFSDIS